MSESVIRVENCGTIVWSYTHRRYYYFAGDLLSEIALDSCFDAIRYDDISKSQMKMLNSCGIFEDARVLRHKDDHGNLIKYPLEYYFDYTSECNLRCPNCYNKQHLGTVSFDANSITSVIEEMHELGIMRLHLAGGEPTTNPRLLKHYLETAKKYNIVTSMATNGTLLNEEICQMLIDCELIAISVSLDGWNSKMNIARRGGDDSIFSKVVDGIERLVLINAKGGRKTEICVKPTYTPDAGREYFEKMILFAIELGVDKIKFANPERSVNHPREYYSENVEKYYENMRIVDELQKNYGDKILITNITNPVAYCGLIGIPGMRGCIGGQELIAINPDGRISPCLMNDFDLGNYFLYGSMKAFFTQSKRLKEYRKLVQNPECVECELYSECRGGCQVRKRVTSGEIKGKDPFCPVGRVKPTIQRQTMNNRIMKVNVYHSL